MNLKASTAGTFTLLCLMLTLSSCGDEKQSPTKDKVSLTFTPGAIEESLYFSQKKTWKFDIQKSGDLANEINLEVDPDNIINNGMTYWYSQGASGYHLELTFDSSLPPGDYSGEIEIRLCTDVDCVTQAEGSPAVIPYELEVKSLTNIKPLSRFNDVEGWPDSSVRSKYVPITLDPSVFSARWFKTIENPTGDFLDVGDLVVKENILMFLQRNRSSEERNLLAVNGLDGTTLWSRYIDNASTTIRTIAEGTTLNLIKSRASFVGLDVNDGAELYNRSMDVDNLILVTSAALSDNVVYGSGIVDLQNAMFAYDLSSGELLWSNKQISMYNYFNVSNVCVNDQSIYFYEEHTGFSGLNRQTGERTLSLADPDASNKTGGYTDCRNGNLVGWIPQGVYSQDLHALDLASGVELWKHDVDLEFQPAVYDGGVFYLERSPAVDDLAKMAVRHIDLLTGEQLLDQDFIIPADIFTGMIVTKNVLFLSTRDKVTAYDLANYEKVWEFPFGGSIAVSEYGEMFVVTPAIIYAINLQ